MEAFEGSKDVFKQFAEKAKQLSKVAIKETKKIVGFHVGQVTEANPKYFIVIAQQGAMVREEIDLDSAPVHGLRRGDLVTAVDISGRRARIIDPVEGWVSLKTINNEPILEGTIAPDKRTQVAQMEKRWDKLKNEQQAHPHPVEVAPVTDGPVVMKEADVATLSAMKAKLQFKSNGEAPLSPLAPSGSIPKLSGPVGGGLKKLAPPAVKQSADELISLGASNSVQSAPPVSSPQPMNIEVIPKKASDDFFSAFDQISPWDNPAQ